MAKKKIGPTITNRKPKRNKTGKNQSKHSHPATPEGAGVIVSVHKNFGYDSIMDSIRKGD
jgi:hypothetical protein